MLVVGALFCSSGFAAAQVRAPKQREQPQPCQSFDRHRLAPDLGDLLKPPDGIIRVYQSTFDELAAAVLPIHFEQMVQPIDLPFCDEVARVDITNVTLHLNPFGSFVLGSGSGTWCGMDLSVSFAPTADVSYDAATQSVKVTMGSVLVGVTLDIPDWADWVPGVPDTVDLDVPVDLGQSLGSIPPIPVQQTEFVVQTARGSRSFTLAGRDVTLYKGDGYVELRGKVDLY